MSRHEDHEWEIKTLSIWFSIKSNLYILTASDKISNKQIKVTLKGTRKKKTGKSQVSKGRK